MSNLYQNISQSDHLNFWSKAGDLDYYQVSNFLDLDKNELSKLGGVSRASVRLDDRIPIDLKKHLEQIANICALVAEFFDGDVGKTALWFKTSNPMLGEISPRDLIRLGRYKKLLKFVLAAREENAISEST